jgi:hypothetical protein
MPLLTIVLNKTGTGKIPVELFGSVAKQPIILTSYYLYCESTQPYFFLKLPFLNNYDSNTNSVIRGSIPIFASANSFDRIISGPTLSNVNQSTGTTTYSQQSQTFEDLIIPFGTYREVSCEFNIARNIPNTFSDYELYAFDGTPIDIYQLILTFTYRRPELI